MVVMMADVAGVRGVRGRRRMKPGLGFIITTTMLTKGVRALQGQTGRAE